MPKELTNSVIHRQNILNNPYALEEIRRATEIKGVVFEGETVVLKSQVARFFEVTPRTVENYLSRYESELAQNGYEVLTGKRLKSFKNCARNSDDREIHFGIIEKTPRLGIFNFRAFLNLAMLLVESDKARLLRKTILDIAIDTINVRTGGGTKYINQRDEGFLRSLFNSEEYRSQFTDALRDYVDLGKFKYPLYTNKIYVSIFKENAQEYAKVLRLSKKDKVRNTFYIEIINLVASYESGLAEELKTRYLQLGRRLSAIETDETFFKFENAALWKPLIDSARVKMASRDLTFRDSLHLQLQDHIAPLGREDFDRFLGEKSRELSERIEEAQEVMKRLKERS